MFLSNDIQGNMKYFVYRTYSQPQEALLLKKRTSVPLFAGRHGDCDILSDEFVLLFFEEKQVFPWKGFSHRCFYQGVSSQDYSFVGQ